MEKINNQEELDSLIEQKENLSCFISLAGGTARSSKDISFDENGDYEVYNEIDDTDEVIPHDRLSQSSIGEALEKGALYKY